MLTLEDIIVDPPTDDAAIELSSVFGRDAPVELEIGSGKGGFLLEQARNRPETSFLGVEWANKYFRFAADRMRRWKMTNVRMIRCDARDLIGRWLPAESISALYVFHPDPWPKRRHAKRRLIQPAFLDALARVLVPDAAIHFQSDHQATYEEARETFDEHVRFETLRAGPAAEDEVVATNFEIKYQREGRTFYTLKARRR